MDSFKKLVESFQKRVIAQFRLIESQTDSSSANTSLRIVDEPWTHAESCSDTQNSCSTPASWAPRHGRTFVIENGTHLERAGVNTTHITDELATERILELCKMIWYSEKENLSMQEFIKNSHNIRYSVSGISCIVHPNNPQIPTLHFNYRKFQFIVNNKVLYQYGGGIDLTPYFVNESFFEEFHSSLKKICDRYNKDWYDMMKKTCDDYFFIEHRKEHRGIGGIFFEHFSTENENEVLAFVNEIIEIFFDVYVKWFNKLKYVSFTEDEKNWQLVRRGRYAEFNLAYDRGTKFGFKTPNLRVESILVSMPPACKWSYECNATTCEEKKLMEIIRKPKKWAV